MCAWTRLGIIVLIAGGFVSAAPQDYGREPVHDEGYDGRFTFVRLRWDSGFSGRRGGGAAWNHDYPRADFNLMKILEAVTLIPVRTDVTRVLALDDPELFKYPIAYMWEPGYWVMDDSEAASFRAYLLKGGFAIFDDFEHDQWDNFEAQMRRVLPEARFVKLDVTHPIFDSFFRMTKIDFPHPMYGILPDLLRHLRGQRPVEAADGDREPQPRRRGVLGVFGERTVSRGPVERRVQAGRELHDLRADALRSG